MSWHGVEDNMGIVCTGAVVEERNEGSGETFMEHMQSSQEKKQRKKRGRDLMIKYNKVLFTHSWQLFCLELYYLINSELELFI